MSSNNKFINITVTLVILIVMFCLIFDFGGCYRKPPVATETPINTVIVTTEVTEEPTLTPMITEEITKTVEPTKYPTVTSTPKPTVTEVTPIVTETIVVTPTKNYKWFNCNTESWMNYPRVRWQPPCK